MTAPTIETVSLVNRYLPTDAKKSEADGGYGWTDAFIASLIAENAYTPAQTVRYFWYQRTQESAEYLAIGGKPLSDIHRQAREMLAYWDTIIQTNPNGMEPLDPTSAGTGHRNISFGTIERPWSE